ncbi:MAG: thioesterase, partial [Tardiphaga sp.]
MSEENTWTGPVVDAHAHFWDPIANDHPWLRPDVIIPLRYGDYSAIKRRYLPDDYRKDAAGHAVCETVYVETEWDP